MERKEQVIETFIAKWNDQDIGKMLELLEDDFQFYHASNLTEELQTFGTFKGKEQFRMGYWDAASKTITDHTLELLKLNPLMSSESQATASNRWILDVKCAGTVKETGKSWNVSELWRVVLDESSNKISSIEIYTDSLAIRNCFK